MGLLVDTIPVQRHFQRLGALFGYLKYEFLKLKEDIFTNFFLDKNNSLPPIISLFNIDPCPRIEIDYIFCTLFSRGRYTPLQNK